MVWVPALAAAAAAAAVGLACPGPHGWAPYPFRAWLPRCAPNRAAPMAQGTTAGTAPPRPPVAPPSTLRALRAPLRSVAPCPGGASRARAATEHPVLQQLRRTARCFGSPGSPFFLVRRLPVCGPSTRCAEGLCVVARLGVHLSNQEFGPGGHVRAREGAAAVPGPRGSLCCGAPPRAPLLLSHVFPITARPAPPAAWPRPACCDCAARRAALPPRPRPAAQQRTPTSIRRRISILL